MSTAHLNLGARAAARVLSELPLVTYVAPLDTAWSVDYVSPQIEAMFGFPAESWVSEPQFWLGRVAEEDRERFLDVWTAVRHGHGQITVDYRMLARNGSLIWVRDTAVVAAAGIEPATVHGFLIDITREKGLELELARERAQTDAFFRDSEAGMAITDAEGRFIRVNDALARMNGITPAQHVGRRLQEINPAVDAGVEPLLAEVRRTGIGLKGRQLTTEVAPGETVSSLVSYFPFEAAGATNYGGVAIDVTELNHALEERAETERRYRRLIEQLPLVTYVNTYPSPPGREWRTTYVSPQIEQLFGYPPQAWLDDSELWKRVVHPDDLARAAEQEREARERGGSVELEYRIIRPDGSVCWVLDLMHVVCDDQGVPQFEQGFVIDVTRRKRAEQAEHDAVAALRDSEEQFRAVFDNALDAIVVTDDEGRYVDVNPTACELFGLERDVFLTMSVPDIERIEARSFDWDAFLVNGKASGSYSIVRPDGSQRDTEFSATANVQPGRHLSIIHDVTKRKLLEQSLLQAQKLESVGTLAGGVAHDFNNMLTAIRGYSQLLLTRVAPGSVEHGHAEEIERAADRAAKLTAQLLAFGRRQILQPRFVDLNAIVEESLPMLAQLAGPNVEVATELEPGLRQINADPGQIEQVIVNLVANSADAMPGGGRITLRTRNGTADHETADLRAGGYVELSVVDSGHGIDPDTLEHVFEPFFTTKAVGRGDGLGLSTAYGIVKQSGGMMDVESVPGSGTTFRVQLPAVAP